MLTVVNHFYVNKQYIYIYLLYSPVQHSQQFL